MTEETTSIEIARRWCLQKGQGWLVRHQLGKGATAPVFEIQAPEGLRALKVYDAAFSSGEKGGVELKRVEQQVALQGHDCKSLVQVYEGGQFEDRLFLLMSRAPGSELEKSLANVPRANIRNIIDQVARAAMFLRSKGLCHRDIKAANVFISDDFKVSTLLDISVARNIYDPLGVGTDHDGQLPILATARYSPPEYLFRILEPGPELWHALDIYQLSALLHDLIMQKPLFEAEHLNSSENRYRFAWVVATVDPKIQADDVDKDLLFLARRGLDKDWKRRSQLQLEDFLSDPQVEKEHAMQLLGLAGRRANLTAEGKILARLERVRIVSSNLEDAIVEYLRSRGAVSQHSIKPGRDDNSKLLAFQWSAPEGVTGKPSRSVLFQIMLSLEQQTAGLFFQLDAKLATFAAGTERTETALKLSPVSDAPGVEAALLEHATAALAELSLKLMREKI